MKSNVSFSSLNSSEKVYALEKFLKNPLELTENGYCYETSLRGTPLIHQSLLKVERLWLDGGSPLLRTGEGSLRADTPLSRLRPIGIRKGAHVAGIGGQQVIEDLLQRRVLTFMSGKERFAPGPALLLPDTFGSSFGVFSHVCYVTDMLPKDRYEITLGSEENRFAAPYGQLRALVLPSPIRGYIKG